MKPKTIKLAANERIVAVVPEYAYGPGWRNYPTFVYIMSASGIRFVCIQSNEKPPMLSARFHAGAAMATSLIGSIKTERVQE